MNVAIVGLGSSYSDFISARVASKKFDEIWGINCIGGIIHVDKTFMLNILITSFVLYKLNGFIISIP